MNENEIVKNERKRFDALGERDLMTEIVSSKIIREQLNLFVDNLNTMGMKLVSLMVANDKMMVSNIANHIVLGRLGKHSKLIADINISIQEVMGFKFEKNKPIKKNITEENYQKLHIETMKLVSQKVDMFVTLSNDAMKMMKNKEYVKFTDITISDIIISEFRLTYNLETNDVDKYYTKKDIGNDKVMYYDGINKLRIRMDDRPHIIFDNGSKDHLASDVGNDG